MSTYKEIQGTAVTNYAGNKPGVVEGELWYDSTNQAFKFQYPNTTSAWSTGGNLNTARQLLQGAGTQTAALVFGGNPNLAVTESYDGSTWTEVNDLNTGRQGLGGTGNQTSALAFGGEDPVSKKSETESWNGTSWTEVNDLTTTRAYMAGSGVDNTSALVFGGELAPPAPTRTAVTESWNGTSWTEVNDLNTSRYALAGNGTQSSALAYGGYNETVRLTVAESWNGTSWTNVNSLNTNRGYFLSGAGADNTSALAFGGNSGAGLDSGATEEWNGVSWTEVNDLSTARKGLAGNGTQASALASGGSSPPVVAATEEWTKSPANLNVDLA